MPPRTGKANEHNGLVPRDHWLERWEKEAIIDFHAQYPLEGYRRLAFMMLDRDVVAVSPTRILAASPWPYPPITASLHLRWKNLIFPHSSRINNDYKPGIVHQPYGEWMKQIARNLTDAFDGLLHGKRYFIHDRDPLFTDVFRRILRDNGIKPLKLPAKSPNLNSYAERFVLSIRSECLTRIIHRSRGASLGIRHHSTFASLTNTGSIRSRTESTVITTTFAIHSLSGELSRLNMIILFSESHLRRIIANYVSHYHFDRNHQGLDNERIEKSNSFGGTLDAIKRKERIGGLLNYYYREAA